MKKIMENIANFFSKRNLLLSMLTVAFGLLFLITLFNIQVINGKAYREQSEKKMVRNETVTAARGEIYDRNGVILATNKLSFDVILYNVKAEVSSAEKTKALYELVNILEENGDSIYSSFPMNQDATAFTFETGEETLKWKKEMSIEESYTPEQVIDHFIQKYELTSYDRKDAISLVKIKYEATLMGYSLFKSATIAKDISQASLAKIEEAKFKLYGVDTLSVPKRYYPLGMVAAHTIGYVSKISATEYAAVKEQGYTQNSSIGKMGIEQVFESYLKGTNGINRSEVDSYGTVSSENVVTKPITGKSVTLTIDYRLQKVAEEALVSVIKEIQTGSSRFDKHEDATAGSVVVLDTTTGEVLAMVSYPSFDINSFVSGIDYLTWNQLIKSPIRPMYNRAIAGTYSPGSTFKMLVGLAGLGTGQIKVNEKIQDPGVYPYGHKPKCWLYDLRGTNHGYITVSDAIKVSCNCYFYEVGRRIGIDEMIEYAKLFGLGQKTGIELTGEKTGQIAGDGRSKEWYLGETLSAAIGQAGNSYTPIQLANYIAAIANGGTLNKVTVVKSVQDNEHNAIPLAEINQHASTFTDVNFQEKNLGLSSEYIDAIKLGMHSVTNDRGGTSYAIFKDIGIEVAGKTGTAEVASGSNNGIFVGFAPYDKPKIAIMAIIEHGGEGTYTANVVRPIMDEYFKIKKQDDLNEKKQNVVENDIVF